MDGEQRVARIVGTLQHVLHLERLEPPGDFVRLRLERALHGEIDVGLGFEKLVELARLIHALTQRVVGLEPTFQRFDFGDRRAGTFGVGPERSFRHFLLELREPRGLPVDVKESP